MKIRLYDLAKQLNLTTKELISKASRAGLVLKNKNPVTMLEDDLAQVIANAAMGKPVNIKFAEEKKKKLKKGEVEPPPTLAPAAPVPPAARKSLLIGPSDMRTGVVRPAPQSPQMAKAQSKAKPAVPVVRPHVPKKPQEPPKPHLPQPAPIIDLGKIKKPAGDKPPSNSPDVSVIEEEADTAQGRMLRPSEVAYYSDTDETVIRERKGKVVKYHKGAVPPVAKDKDADATEEHPVVPEVKAAPVKPTAPHIAQPYKKTYYPSHRKPERPSAVKEVKKISLSVPISLKEFSAVTGLKINQVMKRLMDNKLLLTINQFLTEEHVILLGLEFGIEIEIKQEEDKQKKLMEDVVDDPKDMVFRPPIVTILGHVDHGKTSLLDRIRSTNVAGGESGGITQHIGAYQVMVKGKQITFLDTPGHEAFTAMRARGANATDIAVLVVAADDGVQPQTEEAIAHAKEAKVPIVVALNKMDKKEANVDRVTARLAELGLIPDKWGGNTIYAEVSAVTGAGIDSLLDMLLLQAEMLELKANPKRKARGVVLEAKISEGKGVTATLLIQKGTLHKGDIVYCGRSYGTIRALVNSSGKEVDSASPAVPVEALGLSVVPEAGDTFMVMETIQQAKSLADDQEKSMQVQSLSARQHVTLQNLFEKIKAGATKEVRVIIKADVKGSSEVISESLKNLSKDEVKVKVVHYAVGNINESDILLADVTDSIIVGFHAVVEDRAKIIAHEKGVDIKLYQVIYQLIDDIKKAMEGQLEPEKVEEVTAHLHVKEVFKISRLGTIAGCIVASGKIERNNLVRIFRNRVLTFQGKLSSLKRFKDDAREVQEGYECGIRIDGFDEIEPGDIVEAYSVKDVARKLVF